MKRPSYSLTPLDKSFPDIPLSIGVKRIGRGEESKVNDPCVSRVAIEIEVNDSGVYFTCKSIDNVIRLNGSPCIRNFSTQIKIGDHLSLLRDKYEYVLTQTMVVESSQMSIASEIEPVALPVSSIETQPSFSLKMAEEHLKIRSIIQEEYNCTICQEIIVHCMAIPCGHMFCDECILDWLSRKKECPTCRVEVPTGAKSAFQLRNIDSTIDRLVSSYSDGGAANDSIDYYKGRKDQPKAVIPVLAASASSKPVSVSAPIMTPTARVTVPAPRVIEASRSMPVAPPRPVAVAATPAVRIPTCTAFYVTGKPTKCDYCQCPLISASLTLKAEIPHTYTRLYHLRCIELQNQLAKRNGEFVMSYAHLTGLERIPLSDKQRLKDLLVDEVVVVPPVVRGAMTLDDGDDDEDEDGEDDEYEAYRRERYDEDEDDEDDDEAYRPGMYDDDDVDDDDSAGGHGYLSFATLMTAAKSKAASSSSSSSSSSLKDRITALDASSKKGFKAKSRAVIDLVKDSDEREELEAKILANRRIEEAAAAARRVIEVERERKAAEDRKNAEIARKAAETALKAAEQAAREALEQKRQVAEREREIQAKRVEEAKKAAAAAATLKARQDAEANKKQREQLMAALARETEAAMKVEKERLATAARALQAEADRAAREVRMQAERSRIALETTAKEALAKRKETLIDDVHAREMMIQAETAREARLKRESEEKETTQRELQEGGFNDDDYVSDDAAAVTAVKELTKKAVSKTKKHKLVAADDDHDSGYVLPAGRTRSGRQVKPKVRLCEE